MNEVELPDLDGTWKLWSDLNFTELTVLQEATMRQHGSPDFIAAIEAMKGSSTILDREGYMKAIARRSRVLRDWLLFLEEHPVILTPLSVHALGGWRVQGRDEAAAARLLADAQALAAAGAAMLVLELVPSQVANSATSRSPQLRRYPPVMG